MKKIRYCFDIDGVIAKTQKKYPVKNYSNSRPNKKIIKLVNHLKKKGNYIILYTARRMRTCNSNYGKVINKTAFETMSWLKKNRVSFDEIYFGKPWADIYIDDKAIKFENYDYLITKLNNQKKQLQKDH